MNEQSKGQSRDKRHVWDDPKNVQILLWVFFGCCALLGALDLFVHRHLAFAEGAFAYEGWFLFYPFYGFVACVVLVLVAKQMRKVVMRDEDYYE